MVLEHCEIAHIGVDPVIFSVRDGKLVVFLNEREEPPFKSKYELPGGLVRIGEDATSTIKRKLSEILGKNVFFTQFQTFAKPKRDPRMRIVSIGYVAIVPTSSVTIKNWHDPNNLPKMAFDHSEIISGALSYLRDHLLELVAKQFLPKTFALNQLQSVYEAVLSETYDNRNFRRKMIASQHVVETGSLETNVSHRPAKLFKFV